MITIVDYGVGNLGSIANMFKKVGAEAQISSDPAVIATAEKLVLPGVGAFDNGMANLEQRGLIEPLTQRVMRDGIPIIGLCLGAQLFAKTSEEGIRAGLGWIDARVVRFRFDDTSLKVPHMGWNRLNLRKEHPVFDEMPADSRFYFVHSYHLICNEPSDVLATAEYGYPFAAGVHRGQILGLQCHPEKSHKFGMQVFRNFAQRIH